MTKQEHLDTYKATVAELAQHTDNILNSADPAKALVDGQLRVGELSERATFHLNASCQRQS